MPAWLSLYYSRCFLKLRLGELVESALKGSLALSGNNSHLPNEEGWIQRLPVRDFLSDVHFLDLGFVVKVQGQSTLGKTEAY